ncbi:MAG: P-loop containing nucleoside triphosphate hydrolase protein [Monoraphidium minutum]|nr:MAG: P-loop containing nucleoside triphosphate hydrolase protein [Monoraphidium minutum]
MPLRASGGAPLLLPAQQQQGGGGDGGGGPAAAAAAALQGLPSFTDLLASERQLIKGGAAAAPLAAQREAHMASMLKRFQMHHRARDRALSVFIHKDLYPRAAAAFRKFMLRVAHPAVADALAAHDSYNGAVEDLLFAYFTAFARHAYGAQLAAYAQAVATLDLRAPHSWYPYARSIHRRIIYHAGPTNSGKTYQALQALAVAERGVYCGPLRLLAMEVYEQLNAEGVRCDMVTGQEVLRVPGSGHVACTVEMVGLNAHADVAVIDEIQMIGDEQRGFAWTRALLGLPANEVHVCGDPSAVGLVRQLAEECGDEFELRTYDRMTPLAVDDGCLPSGWADVQPGDCIVAFSRQQLYHIKKEVERASGQKACLVYGALPAETRRAQARLFNDPEGDHKARGRAPGGGSTGEGRGAALFRRRFAPYGCPHWDQVLIASDAIGMGLNFNIRRVVFSTLIKSTAAGRGPVPASLIKQIAGRAGRRNSDYPQGFATTIDKADLPLLREAIALPPEALSTPAAGLAPEFEMVEMLAGQLQGAGLEQLLRRFEAEAKLDGTYFLCNQEGLMQIAKLIKGVPSLSLQDRFTFCMAPVSSRDELVKGAVQEFAHWYAAGSPVIIDPSRMPKGPPKGEDDIAYMESLHRVLSLWMWLSLRFDESCFPGRDRVARMMGQLCAWMNTGLQLLGHAAKKGAPAKPPAAAAAAPGAGSPPASGSAARAAVLAVERLLEEPAYHPSMGRFLRFTATHRLVVPPPRGGGGGSGAAPAAEPPEAPGTVAPA